MTERQFNKWLDEAEYPINDKLKEILQGVNFSLTKEMTQRLLDKMEFNRTLYQSNGYPNIKYIMSCRCPYIILVGGRGTGKTYGFFKYFYDEIKEKFLYMRRTQTQLESCTDAELNPFKDFNVQEHHNIQPFTSKKYVQFQECEEDGSPKNDEEIIALGVALSTFYNLRGFSGKGYNWLFFDEIIPEVMEMVRKGEGSAFKNAIETINRNRELNGEKPIQCILCGNSNRLDSTILLSLGAIDVIENMKKKQQEVYVNQERGLCVIDLQKSPISVLKRCTSLYRVANDEQFTAMALDNDFADLKNATNIKSMNLAEFKPMYGFNNKICVYRHKSKGMYYVSTHFAGEPKYKFNVLLKEDRQRYRQNVKGILLTAIIADIITYESYTCKMLLEDIVYN